MPAFRIDARERSMEVEWPDGAKASFPWLWLADNEPAAFHPQQPEPRVDQGRGDDHPEREAQPERLHRRDTASPAAGAGVAVPRECVERCHKSDAGQRSGDGPHDRAQQHAQRTIRSTCQKSASARILYNIFTAPP